MPTVSSQNRIGSLPKRFRNLRGIRTWSHSPPICASSQRQKLFGDKVVHGAANFGLQLKDNLCKRGESFGEFQMIQREAFARLVGFREDLSTIEDADMFRRLSKIGRTMIDPQLTVLHTGRRAHQVGSPRLIVMWLANSFSSASTADHSPGNGRRFADFGAEPRA
jgi:hypothetical protein